MLSTRQKILCEARNIFNTKGYNEVSLRDISKACGISIGNLTYHFKKKEDLIIEIQDDIYNDLSSILVLDTDYSLKNILSRFQQISINQQNYNYYFRNSLELSRAYNSIKEKQIVIRHNMFKYYSNSFKALVEKGIFREDISSRNYDSLAFSLIFQHTLWYENDSPSYDELFKSINFLQYLHDLICPYFTDEGNKAFRELIKEEN